jgi:hypothetical protein
MHENRTKFTYIVYKSGPIFVQVLRAQSARARPRGSVRTIPILTDADEF